MSWLPWSFWLFCFLPVVDIYVPVELYGLIGGMPVLGAVVGTGLIGGWIFSRQTASVAGRALKAFYRGELPEDEILESVGLLIAGALLATPGFLTDLFGFALLAPYLRLGLMRFIFKALWGSIIFDLVIDSPLYRIR